MEKERNNATIKDSNVSALRMKPIDISQNLWYNNSSNMKKRKRIEKEQQYLIKWPIRQGDVYKVGSWPHLSLKVLTGESWNEKYKKYLTRSKKYGIR